MGQKLLRARSLPRHAALFEEAARLLRKGELEQARRRLELAIELAPRRPECYARLAEVLCGLDRFQEMLRCCTMGLERCGEAPELWKQTGIALLKLELWKDAAVALGRLTRLRPEEYEGYYLLSLALAKSGDADVARNCLEVACSKDDKHAEAWLAWGELSLNTRELERAFDCFHRVLQLTPDSVPANNNLAVILRHEGNPQAAIPHLREALRLQPDQEVPLRNLAEVLDETGQRREAEELYDRILTLYPSSVLSVSAAYWLFSRLCAWDRLAGFEQRLRAAIARGEGQVRPFAVLRTAATPAEQLQCASQFEGTQPIRGAQSLVRRAPESGQRIGRERIRVGYVSADFHEHATSSLIAELFELHDRDRFQVFGYSYGKPNGVTMRTRLAAGVDSFVDVRDLSFEAAANRICEDEIDILVDLKGHTKDTRSKLFSLRPAPVQVAYLGYPGSSGMPYIDYALADPYVIPFGAEQHFSEKIVYLPHCYQINDRRRPFSEQPPDRSEYGLPARGAILCSFNQGYKITPEVFAVWMRLLQKSPDAIIWILEDEPVAIENLQREAASRGVPPERLVFAPRLPIDPHLRRLRLADLMLDTFPVNAHTTASDALWCGCPVLTCSGDTFVSRVAGSLLRTAGVPELITGSLEEYEAKAFDLISHPEQLRSLRAALEANRLHCPLFDSAATTREIEGAFDTMWQIYREGGEPRSFSVRSAPPS